MAACAVGEPTVDVRVAHRQAGAVTIAVTEGGEAAKPAPGNLQAAVETRAGNGAWKTATDVTLEDAPPLIDLMIVADNSASAEGTLPAVQEAVRHLSHVLLARAQDDRVGLVRVSTVASLVQAPSTDAGDLDAAADDLFITNGWTALWDGVRLANDTLEATRVSAGGGAVCFAGAAPSILLFTDGRENNSADQQDSRYEGDGVDTTLDDLLALSAGGVATAIYTVGIGDEVDADALATLAAATGGQHRTLGNHQGLVGALHAAAAELDQLVPLCFTPAACGDDQARITIDVKVQGQWQTHVLDVAIPPGC